MKLYNIFNEDWQTVRGYDKERYTELPGLDGPISTKSGKVLYYDTKQGQYYDRDSDMYMDHDDALAFLNEDFEAEFGVPLVEKNKVASTGKTERILSLMQKKYPQADNEIEALLLHFDAGQNRDRIDINRLSSENDAEEEEIEQLQKELDKIKYRRGMSEAESDKEKAERVAIAKIQDQFKDLPKYTPQSAEERAKAHKEREAKAMEKAKENADMLMKLADKHGENISANEVGYFAKGIADGKRGYSDPKAGDALGPNVYAYDAGVRVGEKLGASVNEDYYETDEQRELARLGRIIMDMGAKRDDDIGTAMGAVGNELTRYGTPQGVNSIQKLEKVTGQPESVIMKMMALAQKVEGDVAVGADVPDEEVEEGYKKDYLTREKERIGRASDEFDVTPDNWEVKIDGKPWKVFRNKSSANQAASTIEMRYGKKTTVFATRKPVSEGIAEDFDDEFAKGIHTRLGGDPDKFVPHRNRPTTGDHVELKVPKRYRKAQDVIMKTFAKLTGIDQSKLDVDYTTGSRSVMIDGETPHPSILSALNGTLDKLDTGEIAGLYEALDHDIKIGDTVETKKMGQMQGTVTGFSTKYGDTRVMFKHKSGKVYATPASNLKVIDTVKKTESQVAENIDLRHNLQPGTYKHNEENITVTINNDSSVSFKQPAEWEIEGDGEYLEFVEAQLADAGNWTAVVEEAKKKPVPTKPDKWAYAKSQAKEKFDVYPSAYANAWAAKKYKELGGGWRMGKPKK